MTATNINGADSEKLKINILDILKAPENMRFDDITKDSCVVSWKPPRDDGGSPITNYIVERRDEKFKVWTKLSSFIRGCHYDVIGLEANKSYHFRVSAENQYGVGIALQTDKPITAKFAFNRPDAPGKPTIEDYSKNTAILSWERPLSDGGPKIQGYSVEYREPNNQRWFMANEFPIKNTSFLVNGLIENREYEFRVKAKNAAGYGKTSPPSITIKIKDKFAVPSPPRNIHVTKVGKTYVDLKWESPKYDGGCKVTHYVVERKESSIRQWISASSFCKDTIFTVQELTEGCEYLFRVIAVNENGQSKPLVGENPVIAKLPFDKPLASGVPKATDGDENACRAVNKEGTQASGAKLIITDAPKIYISYRFMDVACFERGENVSIKLPFTGNPKPKLWWSKDGEVIDVNERFEISYTEKYTLLIVKNVSKVDSGHYCIFAENEWGFDTATITLQIIDKPDSPRFLNIEQINNDNVTISWKAPLLDGYSTITNYVIEKREPTMETWVRCGNTRSQLYIINELNPNKN